jgi:hypothetical protein
MAELIALATSFNDLHTSLDGIETQYNWYMFGGDNVRTQKTSLEVQTRLQTLVHPLR